jgi:membrane protease YdiL (CAAX protease family)
MKEVAAVVVAVAATYAVAFRPELRDTATFFALFGIPHALLAAYALHRLHVQGKLVGRLTPRFGDLSLGALAALVLLAASWSLRSTLAPAGTTRMLWALLIYAQLGDPETLQRSLPLTLALLAITLFEEIIWRGLVLERLNERLGNRLGWLVASLLYALAALPTVYTLRVPGAGYNPLLVFAAFGCGLVWTFLAARLGRIWPSVVSHGVFTYFSAVQFRLPL